MEEVLPLIDAAQFALCVAASLCPPTELSTQQLCSLLAAARWLKQATGSHALRPALATVAAGLSEQGWSGDAIGAVLQTCGAQRALRETMTELFLRLPS